MHTFIIILTVIISVLLIGIVLVQKSKGGGLSSQFGNLSSTMGVQQTNTFLEKGTWWLAGIIFFLSIASAYTDKSTGLEMRTKASTEQTQPMPGENQFGTTAAPIPVDAVPQGTTEGE